MNKMRFDIKYVKEYLVKNKIVYMVRSWEGYSSLSKVEFDGVGPCMKKRIMRVTGKGNLAKYLSLSGFGSLEDWWEKIEVRILSVSSFSEQRKSL